jgi:hypothetical protein
MNIDSYSKKRKTTGGCASNADDYIYRHNDNAINDLKDEFKMTSEAEYFQNIYSTNKKRKKRDIDVYNTTIISKPARDTHLIYSKYGHEDTMIRAKLNYD